MHKYQNNTKLAHTHTRIDDVTNIASAETTSLNSDTVTGRREHRRIATINHTTKLNFYNEDKVC